MKNIIAMMVGALLLTACPPPETGNITVNNNASPGQVRELESAVASALDCSPQGLTWSIREASNPGFTSPLDGSVTQNGVFTAPQCGSIYIGTVMHVVATCSSNGRMGTVNMAIAQEILDTVQVALAVANPGTPEACHLLPVALGAFCPGGTSACSEPNGCYCVKIGQQVQFYAQLNFTCGPVFTPPLPDPLPADCQ